MREDLTEIGKAFGLKGTLSGYEIVKNGNINETYRVTYKTDDGGKEVYIFQRVNTYVFRRPEEIMANIERVTSHIREKSVGRPTLCFYHTPSGANYICRQDGSFWRIMNFIDSVTFDVCDRPDIIRAAGEAFGEFQLQLSDFDGSVLYETIADFHNTRRRLDTLFDDAERDPVGRAAGTAAELEKIRAFADAACQLCDRYSRHEFPVRVTHNDTKASNVLFDRQTLRPLAVVDLDTVMPGMAMYDFGDAVRFLASTAAEDEADLTKVSLDIGKFTAFAEGFVGKVRDSLTAEEIDGMALGAFSVTVELAARFLDDYLNGDVYFRTDSPIHNLVRARCQLRLAEDMLQKLEKLRAVVAGIAGRSCAN